MGHELGHFLLGHNIEEQHLVESQEGYIKKRAQEISVDRIGLLACRDINKNRDLSNKYELTTDWNKILNSPQIDGVIIATPPEMHYQIAKEAIEKNKPIIIEKPIT